MFAFESPEPVASASIGQVYKATLADGSGRVVAVKVQRPDAAESASLDMHMVRELAAVVKRWKKLRTDLVAVADTFGNQLFDELDYEQEARNCAKFKRLYADVPNIYVPECVDEFTSRRVLCQEWVEGTKGPWAEDGEKMLVRMMTAMQKKKDKAIKVRRHSPHAL